VVLQYAVARFGQVAVVDVTAKRGVRYQARYQARVY
jgi:hypothetical protein